MNEKIIYTRWVAIELRKLGYKILRTEPHPHRPELDSWVFEVTPGFIEDFTRITAARPKVD